MEKFRITGPVKLAGKVRASGAKNAALPALAASLLIDGELRLRGLPKVRDIATMRRMLEHLGVSSREQDDWIVLERTEQTERDDAPYDLVKTMRASVLVLGPLLAHRGYARVSLPGGCAIGVRPIDQHLAGLEALGAQVDLDHGYVTVRASQLRGCRFRFATPTVGGTENLLMAATLAKGDTELENCACEPEIADLADLLTRMGAQIEGAGTNSIHVQGVDQLGSASHEVIADRIEAGTYLLGAVITAGDVTVEGLPPIHLAGLIEKLEQVGATVTSGDRSIRVRHPGEVSPADIATAPFPGFPTDLQAQYLATMTQATGESCIHETVFENRFQHVPELARMGAQIETLGSFATVHGPTPLSGATVMATDLRASACLVLASLVATGVTMVDRIYHLDRGYERMESKLQQLGATVERVG